MTEINFDVNAIVTVRFYEERPTDYVFVEAKPAIKWFFGLITIKEATKEGFSDGDYFSGALTEETLNKYGYKVYPKSERLNNRVCRKARIDVDLEHGYSVSNSFDSDGEALGWAKRLKEISKKTFETVGY